MTSQLPAVLVGGRRGGGKREQLRVEFGVAIHDWTITTRWAVAPDGSEIPLDDNYELERLGIVDLRLVGGVWQR